jgi:hypothetical protein
MLFGMRRFLFLVVFVAGALGSAGCGDDAPDAPDGYRTVATGDLYGEWELLAEFRDGDWTGCLRLEPDPIERCADPDAELVEHEDHEITFGAVGQGETLLSDGDEVDLFDGRFFVRSAEEDLRLAD